MLFVTAVSSIALALPLLLGPSQDGPQSVGRGTRHGASQATGTQATGAQRAVAQPTGLRSASTYRMKILALEHASAAELQGVLRGILMADVRIVGDARTNSLIVGAYDDASLNTVATLVAALDVEVARPVTAAPRESRPLPPLPAPEIFAPVKGDLELAVSDMEGGMSMLQLITTYAAMTGQNITISAESRALLDNARIGLLHTTKIAQKDVQSFVESLLIVNDFLLVPIKTSPPRLIEVVSLKTQVRNSVKMDSIVIDAAHLDMAASHPAVLFTVAITMKSTDVRQLSNAMRTMITDANTQQLLPAGSTDTLVLTGFGNHIARIAKMLRVIDAASEASARAAAAEQARALAAPRGTPLGAPAGSRPSQPKR